MPHKFHLRSFSVSSVSVALCVFCQKIPVLNVLLFSPLTLPPPPEYEVSLSDIPVCQQTSHVHHIESLFFALILTFKYRFCKSPLGLLFLSQFYSNIPFLNFIYDSFPFLQPFVISPSVRFSFCHQFYSLDKTGTLLPSQSVLKVGGEQPATILPPLAFTKCFSDNMEKERNRYFILS